MTEEDTGIMQLQATKDCQQLPEARREMEQILPRRNQSHWPWFWTSGLQNC